MAQRVGRGIDVHTYYPPMRRAAGDAGPSVAAVEALLADWFGDEVVLLSSGRSALHWYLAVCGWHRYHHQLVVPPYLSRCVVNAVTRDAFPVHFPQRGQGTLLYHQFGFPQRYRPRSGITIEDIAHSFYATPETGRRSWRGAAIFSLPKFFGIGMAGGLVLSDSKLALRVREAAAVADSAVRDADRIQARRIIWEARRSGASARTRQLLESAYEFIGSLGRPQPADLAGFPDSVAKIVELGRARMERVEYVRSCFGRTGWPAAFWPQRANIVPFAVPLFPRRSATVSAMAQALAGQEVTVGVYHIDVRRSMARPQYRPALLLPCHATVPLPALASACDLIAHYDKRSG